MKSPFVSLISLTAILGIAPPARLARAGAADPPLEVKQAPSLACNRSALTEAERKRHFDELGPALRRIKKSARELPDGYEFEFPGDKATIGLVTEWVAGEAACCPFFDIGVRIERQGGPLRLSLTGGPGVKRFIEVDAAAWLKP
jgi:hypothetical protein